MYFNGHKQRNTEITAKGQNTDLVLLLFQYRTTCSKSKDQETMLQILEDFKNGAKNLRK